MAELRFPVDPVHVMLFARAVCDDNPAYRGEAGVAAPPTFTEALQQFIPGYPWRPRPGEPWPASAKAATVDRPGTVVLHAEQRFTYTRPVRVGEVLVARKRTGNSWQKPSRAGGVLSFREIVTDFHDGDDAVIVSSVAVEVEIGADR
ncbi:MAG: hypothetical protein JWL79_3331 [Frankiales bacterium]|nr:hypothetical protein [Frankiales bacterium]